MNRLHEDLDEILSAGRDVFESLRGARLFITGGTGFFGTWLLESLVHANNELKLNATALVLTRDPDAFTRRFPHLGGCGCVQFHRGDVTSFDFPAGTFTHIIHAATEASAKLNEEDPLRMLDTTVAGTRRVLEMARQCGAKRLLLTSSGAVYGPQPSEMTHVPEEYAGAPDPMDLRSAYGQGKRLSEHLCAVYQSRYGIETAIARCFAFVGPHLPLDKHFAIGNFIRNGLDGRVIEVGGDGTPYRSYLYVSDLTSWLWTILVRGQACRPYNVGSEEDLTIAELAGKVAAYFGTSVRVAKAAVPGAKASRYVPGTKRAQRELGLRQNVSLGEAIERTARWCRAGGV